jgi:hypothetical protein
VSLLSSPYSALELLVESSSAVNTLDAAGKRRTSHERGNNNQKRVA